MKFNFPSVLLILSLVCFIWVVGLICQRYIPVKVAFNQTSTQIATSSSELVADGLSLPELDLALPIIPAALSNNSWPVTSRGIIYLSSTPQPGTPGNSVLYGHNWPNLLGKLSQAKQGQAIIVHYTNGLTKSFVISAISQVSPTDVSILKPTADTRLTLYTCTGFLDTRRLVVTAHPS